MDAEHELTQLQDGASDENEASIPATPTLPSTHTTKLKSRACDTCHKRKVKCDNAKPSCSGCVKFGAECTYIVAAAPKKITRRRPKRREALEKRVNELENILRQALNSHEAATRNQLDESPVTLEPTTQSNQGGDLSPPYTVSPNTSNDSNTGHAKGSLLNEELVEWIPRPFRSTTRLQHDFVENKKFCERQQLVALIRIYFNTFNRTVTLFDQHDFFARFSELDMDQIRADAALWTATNVMCALALRQKPVISVDHCPRARDHESWQFLHCALDKAVELTVRGSDDLLAIQALLGMAIFLQASPDAHPASTILAAAIRLVLQNGLHLQKDEQLLAQLGLEAARLQVQRNRVFWIAYYLDHDLAIRLERPPLIHEDDIGVELPPLYPEDGLGHISSVNGSIKINFMHVRAHLALIESHIHRRLTSAKAKRQTGIERQTAIQELEVELYNWKASSPDLNFALEYFSTDRASWTTFGDTAIYLLRVLYLTYLNCHTSLHGLSYRALRVQAWDYPRQTMTADSSTLELLPSIIAAGGDIGPPSCCLSSARASLVLLHLSENSEHACTWAVLHYHITALIILVAHAAKNPLTEESMADIQLVLPVVDMLRRFEELSKDTNIGYAKKIAAQLVHEYARRALFN